ncbi:MAG: hypothetical protein JSV89_10740 [Spirochaetaceae bacterium]|nr:MAG: hypothetical protein JSV89_10740 [Spirochaetaceae bacterium]
MNEHIERSFIDIIDTRRMEERLHQAQKMAVFGRMARGIAHDFNNILAIINGYTEILLGEDKIPGQVEHGLREIRKACVKATEMTGQILSFWPKEFSRPKATHLHHIIRNAEKMLLRLLRRGVALRLDLCADTDLITLAPCQIEKLLIELVLSTQDAFPQGGNIIIQTTNSVVNPGTDSTLCDLKPGLYLILQVRDSGGRTAMSHAFCLDPLEQIVPDALNANSEA